MPYIKDKMERWKLDTLVQHFFLNNEPLTGRMNYLIFKIAMEFIKKNGESYKNYQTIIGELECAKQEIFRRMVAKYEDKKIKENGDVK